MTLGYVHEITHESQRVLIEDEEAIACVVNYLTLTEEGAFKQEHRHDSTPSFIDPSALTHPIAPLPFIYGPHFSAPSLSFLIFILF